MSGNVLIDEVARRLMSSVFTSGLWLLIVLLIIWLFRIRNPSLRFMFLLIPLAKSLVVLLRVRPEAGPFEGAMLISLQWPNPRGIIPTLPEMSLVPKSYTLTSTLPLIGIDILLVFTVAFIVWRLIGLFRFEKILAGAPEVNRSQYERVYVILGRLAKKIGIAPPKLIQIDSHEAPFTLGIRQPVIAASTIMLSRLSDEELEAVFAHEIAHVVRRDHLTHWPVILLRDLLFFNPFTGVIYRHLSLEKERSCDEFGSSMCDRTWMAKGLVKMAELRDLTPSYSVTRVFAPQSFFRGPKRFLAGRVDELLRSPTYSRPKTGSLFLIGVVAFMLFYTEIHIVLMLSNGPFVIS